MSGEKVKESGADALEAASIAVYDKDEFEGLPDEGIVKLCSDYAAYTRISLAEEHGQVGGCRGRTFHLPLSFSDCDQHCCY